MMNNLNLHNRHPKDLPDKETIEDILLELKDTHKFNIKWVNLDNMSWRANNKVFDNWLEKGEVVISDRFFDSSVAYQGAGRVLSPAEVARISRWATESLTPTLTIIKDLPAEVGLARLQSTDRLESEPLAFHERVRHEYLNLAYQDPERFLLVDATLSIEQIHQIIIERVGLIKALKRNQKN